MSEQNTKVKTVNLKECGGDLEQINKAVNGEIKIWMKDSRVSISSDRNTAVITFNLDISTQEKLIAYHAENKINFNIPCLERVL